MKTENMAQSIEENEEDGSAINSNHHEHEHDNKKTLEADIRKAVRLSLDSFENHYGILPADVKNGTVLRSDVYQYVIMQSQWRLRQLPDGFMPRCEMHQTFTRDHRFVRAILDSLAAMRIASRDEPKEAFALTPSIKLPIDNFIGESPITHFFAELNKKDQVDEDAKEIDIQESASELEDQLVAMIRNILEELEQERQQKEAEKSSTRHTEIIANDTKEIDIQKSVSEFQNQLAAGLRNILEELRAGKATKGG